MDAEACVENPATTVDLPYHPFLRQADDVRTVPTRYRQIQHDIQHQVGTIMVLAGVVSTADDVGPASRARIDQIIGETRWLDELLRASERIGAAVRTDADPDVSAPVERIRIDTVVGEVVDAPTMAGLVQVSFAAAAAWAFVDRLSLWRAVRNVLDNACRAAGPHGRVAVRVTQERGWSVVQVDDDGPGFGAGPTGTAGMGLDIVQDVAAAHQGSVEVGWSDLGGCRIRIVLPAAPPVEVAP